MVYLFSSSAISKHLPPQLSPFFSSLKECAAFSKPVREDSLSTHKRPLDLRSGYRGSLSGSRWIRGGVKVRLAADKTGGCQRGQWMAMRTSPWTAVCASFLGETNCVCLMAQMSFDEWTENTRPSLWWEVPNLGARSERKGAEWKKTLWFFFSSP